MRFPALYLLIVTLILASGCSSIVKKPDVNKVKTAAIISIYANSDVKESKGGGSVSAWNSELKRDVSLSFHDEYVDSFGNNLGWQMVSADKLMESDEYKNMFRMNTNSKSKAMNKLGGIMNKLADMNEKYSYFSPEKMHPIQLSSQNLNSVSYRNGKRVDVKSSLANMAKQLDVDAVIVVQMDYCYEPNSVSMLKGFTKGHMTAASTIRAVDQKGNMVVNMGDLNQCAQTKNRGKSKQGLGLLGGNIAVALKDKEVLEKMFMEATRENIKLTMSQLKKAMK